MANSTPDTPDVSETKLAALKMDQLRTHARKLGIDGADELHKPELLAKVKDYHYAQAHGGKHRDGSGAGSSTDGRPSASELSSMKLGELREHARKHGIDGADELHKPELLAKVKDHHAGDSQLSATELSNMKLGELREHPASTASTVQTSYTNPNSWPRSRTTTTHRRTAGSTATGQALAPPPPVTGARASCRA